MADPDEMTGPVQGVGDRPEATPPPMPRWVKTSAIVVGSLLVLFVILQLTGVAQHGPGMHGG